MKKINLIEWLWKTDSHEKQSPQRFGRYAVMLIMLLTLGVGQMWGDNGDFYNMYIAYSFEGAGGAIDGADNNTGVTVDAGTLTSGSLTLTGVYLKCWDDWGSNYKSSGGQLCYTNKGGSTQYISCTRSGKSGNNYEYQNSNPGVTLASYNQASGSFEFHCWGQTWGWGDRYFPKSSGHYVLKYKIAPPAVSGFTITPSGEGYVSGTGTESDPYIMKHDAGNLVLTMSGSKAHTDANSSAKYYNGSSWSATATKTIAYASGSTTKKSVTLKMKYNNSTASLDGAESSIKVYYQRESTNTVSASASPAAGGSVTPSSSTTTGQKSGIAISASNNTGYTFSGWSIVSGSGSFVSSTTTASNRFKPTSNTSLRATFTAKNYTVTLNKNGGDSNGSVQTTYNSSSTSSFTGASRAGYSCDGYFTDPSTGSKVINADGTLVSGTVSGWLSSGNWVKDAASITLYAHWTEDITNYTVTYAVKSDQTSLGSLSCAKTVGGAAVSSGSEVASGTGVTFTASPITGYEVDAWCSNPACTTPIAGAGYANTYATSVTADLGVYVKFKKKIYTITYSPSSAPTGCTYTTKPTTGTYGNTVTMVITPSTGYTVSVSARDASSNVVTISNPSANTYTFTQPASAVTVTVTATETKSTITVTTATSSQGTLKFGSTSKSWGATASLGVATTQEITATAAAGFRFVRWDLTGAAASASSLTSATITLKADGSGSTGTATAVFEEDLSSPWIVAGGNKIVTTGTTWRTTADANNTMLKKTGHSTESVVYFTVPVTTVCSGDHNENFQFKIYNTSTSTWYGLFASGSYYLLKAEDGTEKSLVEGNKNIELRAYVTGDYEFKLDYSTSTPKLTVTWPVFNQVRISAASPTDATNTGNFDLSDPVSNVRSVKRSLNANTTYTFKIVYNSDFYGYNSGTFTRSTSTSSNSRTISTSGGDMTLTTDYAGDYTFKFNQSTKALSVDFPTAYKITFGKGSVDGTTGSFSAVDLDNGSSAVTSNSTWVKSGDKVKITAPSAKSGYRFLGWYDNNSATGDAITTLANCTITVNTTKTVYACYALKQSALTFDYQTGVTGYGSSGSISAVSATYDAAMPSLSGSMPTAAEGYAFMGFYDATGGGGTKYYNADGSSAHTWDKDVTTGTTLYAYYKNAEITALTLDAGIVEPEATVGVTPTISPTPTGTTIICWTILHSNDTPLDPQPAMTWSEGKLTFAASSYSGTYKVRAVLRTGNDCGGGTALDTETANFQVAGSHTVTVNYKCGDDVIKAATSVTATPLNWSGDITAPDIFGYTFARWDAADGVTIKNGDSDPVTTTTEATIQIKATYNGKLTAVYTQKSMIYFKNTLGWSDVYVNFYTTSDWDSSDNGSGSQKGAGNKNVTNRNKHMTQIDDTDIWYYDYGAASISPSLYVSFTSASQNNVNEFWAANPGIGVVYPANYPDAISTDKSSENGFKAATPMFVPIAAQDPVLVNVGGGGRANYYNAGYWTKYTPGTGYRLEIYNNGTGAFIKAQDFTSADDLMPMKVTVDLEGGQTYKFQLRRGGESSAGVYYGNSGTMTYTNHGQDTPWDMTNSSFSMCKITTNAAGDYTFNLSYSGDGSTPPHYRLRIAVDYPVASGDYRLVYSDAVQTKPLTSAIVNKVDNGTDIVSFFVRPGSTPVLRIQQATVNPSTGAITWNEYPNSGTPTNQITGTIASTISSSGTEVYNFNLSMNGSGALTVASAEVYDGKFYIRTDAANSKWDNYRTDPDHVMTYSEYSITHGGFTHYYCHWVDKDDVGRKNVKFVIANDYSPNISDTLAREAADGTWANIDKFMEEGGDLKRSANVRFMWDKRNNTISRAYVDGAQGDYSTNFLYMLNVEDGADKIKKEDGTALTDHKITFKDNGNWMYEANIKAQPEAKIKLLSNWGTSNTITQYFRGASDATETLLGGSGSTWYDIRIIYDFKTNRLIAGLIPSGTIDDQMAIHADVMFVREHHGDIAQLTFAEKDSKMGAITNIETAYGVLQFNKWTINNKSKAEGHSPLSPLLSRFERDIFYISFPFRVSMEEVFGFGTYGQHWIIEEYDGAGRATNGYWQESDPNWKFVFNRKNKFFEPGTGYVIALDLDEMGESADIWANTDQVELYFPSYGTMDNITSSTATYNIPEHLCTINRSNESNGNGGTLGSAYDRRVKDSHWNVLGVPTYVNPGAPNYANTAWTTSATETSVGPNFLYEWNKDDNSLSAVSARDYTYHAMHAYLVQYCGNVTWTSSVSVTPPAIIAAHRTSEERPQSVEFRLEMLQNGEAVDQTFVKLSDNEAVTTSFEFNYDLSKEFNSGRANIYTLIGTEPVAGNVLPMTDQTTVVPVGVKIAADGDYTFSMPDGTEGIGITLVDTETGIRTILSALDYTVNLTAGTYDNRFFLEISPIMQTPTDVEEVTGDGLQVTGARKVIIDQKMYIIKDGKIYDAQGRQVK